MADVAGSRQLVEEVKAVLGDLAVVCVGVEPADLLATDAGRLIELSGAFDRQSAGMRALALDRALEAKVWKEEGFKSPQQYVAAKLGVTVGEAVRMVATAERLRSQPETREAMRNGELSDDEADAVTEANEAEPEREAEHLDATTGGSRSAGDGEQDELPGGASAGPGPRPRPGRRESIAELRRRRERAKARADRDAKDTEDRLHRERSASKGVTSEGGWQLWMRTTKAAGLRVEAAWQVAMDELRVERKAKGLAGLTYGQLAADALVRMADRSLGATATAGGPVRRSKGSAMRGMINVDLAPLKRGWLEGDEVCEIAGFGPVSIGLAKDLLGDAVLTLVLRDGKDVVNLTPLGNVFSEAQRVAIWARAGGICETPGCGATAGLEIDRAHVVQLGGLTEVANGRLHCWPDHVEKTHGTKRLIGPPGRRACVDVADLPWDPAREGPIPTDDVEHLLPSERPARAGPAPPTASASATPSAVTSPEGEQLDLLPV